MTTAAFHQRDNRIHCVLYFFAAHRIKEIDSEFILQLAPLVPIVPIVAKADTMTIPERNHYMRIVREEISKITTLLGSPCIYDFGNDQPVELLYDLEVSPNTTHDIACRLPISSCSSTNVSVAAEVNTTNGKLEWFTDPTPTPTPTLTLTLTLTLTPTLTPTPTPTQFEVTDPLPVESEMDGHGHGHAELPMTCTTPLSATPMPVLVNAVSYHGKPTSNATIAPVRMQNIFAVVCDKSDEREYPWGSILIYDMNSSDLRRLQILLFGNGELHYYQIGDSCIIDSHGHIVVAPIDVDTR